MLTPIAKVLDRIDEMSIEELEREIQERAEIVDVLRADQALLIPHLDRKWEFRTMERIGPPDLKQGVSFGK